MQLQSNLEDYERYDVNLLSFMVLDIENLHSRVNFKQGFQTMLQCPRSFASSINENLKYLTQWSTYYFTSKDSCYPSPVNVIHFKDIKMPAPLSPARMTAESKETMRERESVNGKEATTPRSNYGKAGTLPESCYHQELKPTYANEDIKCNFDYPRTNKNQNLEDDTDNSLEGCLDNIDEEVEISKEETFLVGRS